MVDTCRGVIIMQDTPAVSLRFFCLIIDPEKEDPKASLMFLRVSLLKGSKVERRRRGDGNETYSAPCCSAARRTALRSVSRLIVMPRC